MRRILWISLAVVSIAIHASDRDVVSEFSDPTTETVIETTVETLATFPTEPVEPVEPVEPTESTEVTDVTEPTDATEATESSATTEPTVTVESTEIADTINLGEFRLTAYCPCEKCCGYWATIRPLDKNGNPIVYTASGTIAEEGRTIAVDPTVIPHGTEVVINGHTYVAEDTGGAIKGNRIDVYFEDHDEAWDFGVQYADVYIVGS